MIFKHLFNSENFTSQTGWYFPSGKNLEKTSASNAYVETFNDKKMESLAREVCQNSLDAADGSGKAVKVSFDMITIPTKDIPGYQEFLKRHLVLAKETWPNEEKTQKLLHKMEQTLLHDETSVLKISDFHTTGLEPQNWSSLIEQAGSSVKSSDESGGSFGIGKAAPFAVSDLRMIFYNTLANQGHEQSIGVSKFVSYDLENGETTQGTGYYGSKEKIPFDNGMHFEQNPRSMRGTDIYIIGFDTKDFPNWKVEIINSILDNFLVSIHRQQLEVSVDGDSITTETTAQYIENIKMDKKLTRQYSDLISYSGVLFDVNHIKVTMPGFAAYGIEDGEATLLLSNQVEPNRRILMTRKAGMKIFDQKYISSILKFSGIFQAKGSNINRILKEFENPNHDKWSIDRADNKKNAKLFLDHITKFIKDTVKEHFQEKISEQVDAFGVSDFLPDSLENIGKDGKNLEQPLVSNRAKLSMKSPYKNKDATASIRSEEDGDLLVEELRKVGIEEGDSGGSGFNREGSGGGLGLGENTYAGGNLSGHHSNTDEGNEALVEKAISRKKISNLKYRVMEVDAKRGLYQIVLKPEISVQDTMIAISVIGDSGNKSKVRVLGATNETEALKTRANAIYTPSLSHQRWERLAVKLNQNNRLKLEVEVYANLK